ncbi:FxsA family protein [Nitratiruptor sp. SB155-2]|uniref:FxsA family protein n=1 Tax=Nitratiruptor sp. (strain SB155-2) TaxID=387092 RepID=UPI0001587303|nr:FxsA family protein [Nitratiruptor sp. SB155-2]BAF70132.1 conserved hypothetical protein [Nitratiruptor sp. SB155-2]
MIYFVLYLFIETVISVSIASQIGPIWTFVEIIATATYGIWLLKNIHIQLFTTMQALANGEITQEEFEQMNLSMVLGAVLLIIPGFFTDILGILLQFGVFSKFLAKKIFKLKAKEEEDDVIDVEVIER